MFSQTEIGDASVSMAAACVRLAGRIYPSIWQQKVLLIGAGLMVRTMIKLYQVDAGFHAENVLTMTLDLNWSRYLDARKRADGQRLASFYRELMERVRARPDAQPHGKPPAPPPVRPVEPRPEVVAMGSRRRLATNAAV